jgi:hypothetical protein
MDLTDKWKLRIGVRQDRFDTDLNPLITVPNAFTLTNVPIVAGVPLTRNERRHFILGRGRAAIYGPIESPALNRPRTRQKKTRTPQKHRLFANAHLRLWMTSPCRLIARQRSDRMSVG